MKLESINPKCCLVIRPENNEYENLHLKECIRLHTQDKICEGNAFALKLIDLVHALLYKGKFRNFELAVPTLAAGTSIYSARVDLVHRNTKEILSTLSVADRQQRYQDGNDTNLVASPRCRDKRNNLNNSSFTSQTGNSKILSSRHLSRIRLHRPPQDDVVFRKRIGDFDSCTIDNAALNELEDGVEDIMTDEILHVDQRFLQQFPFYDMEVFALKQSGSAARKVYLRPVKASFVDCDANNNAGLIKLSDIKQEIDHPVKTENVSSDPEDYEQLSQNGREWKNGVEEWKNPNILLSEINCSSVEEYVDLLNHVLGCQLKNNFGELGDQFVGDLSYQRRSNRKRPHTPPRYKEVVVKKKRRTRTSVNGRTKAVESTTVNNRVGKRKVKQEVTNFENTSARYNTEYSATMTNGCVVTEIDDDDQSMSDDVMMYGESIDLSEDETEISKISCLSSRSATTPPSVNIRAIIRSIGIILGVKREPSDSNIQFQFSYVLETLRGMKPETHITPAIVLFCLLHLAEEKSLLLESDGLEDILITRL